jgi:hypothetical protein
VNELSLENESDVPPILYVLVPSSCFDPAIKVLLVIKVSVEQPRDLLISCDQKSRDHLGLSTIA